MNVLLSKQRAIVFAQRSNASELCLREFVKSQKSLKQRARDNNEAQRGCDVFHPCDEWLSTTRNRIHSELHVPPPKADENCGFVKLLPKRSSVFRLFCDV